MPLRIWISIVATLGVLLHAGFLVRHSLAMSDAARQYRTFLADLGSLCRASAGASGERLPASDLPQVPSPSSAHSCPVCAGLVGAFALMGPQPAAPIVPTSTAMHLPGARVTAAGPLPRAAHPPARGPPALA
jgi:hypothetical protein